MDKFPLIAPGFPNTSMLPVPPTIQGTLNNPNTADTLTLTPKDLTIYELFGPSQAEVKCSRCAKILGTSIMLKDFKNNTLCETCYKQTMICSMSCGNLACAYIAKSSQMFCFDCSMKIDHSELKTFINILDNSEYANFNSIISLIPRGKLSSSQKELVSLHNRKTEIDFEYLMEQVINLCKGYEGNRIGLVLIKYLLLLDKDHEALDLACRIKEKNYFRHAATIFLDLCSVENLLDPRFKSRILGFMEEDTRITTKRLNIYKEASIDYSYLSNIQSNLNDFPVYLGFKKDLLLIDLANGNYNGVESYVRYLDILLPPSIYKTKCLRSIASLAFKSCKYELSSSIGERAIISHLINKKNDYTDMAQLAFIVAKSKIHSGKDAGVLNLLALVYEDAEKSENIPKMRESCELAKEFYSRTNPENSERVQAKIDFLRSTPRQA